MVTRRAFSSALLAGEGRIARLSKVGVFKSSIALPPHYQSPTPAGQEWGWGVRNSMHVNAVRLIIAHIFCPFFNTTWGGVQGEVPSPSNRHPPSVQYPGAVPVAPKRLISKPQ